MLEEERLALSPCLPPASYGNTFLFHLPWCFKRMWVPEKQTTDHQDICVELLKWASAFLSRRKGGEWNWGVVLRTILSPSPEGHLTLPGDIFDCLKWARAAVASSGERLPNIWHSIRQHPHSKELPCPKCQWCWWLPETWWETAFLQSACSTSCIPMQGGVALCSLCG